MDMVFLTQYCLRENLFSGKSSLESFFFFSFPENKLNTKEKFPST